MTTNPARSTTTGAEHAPEGRFGKAKQTTHTALDELNKAFHAHAELAKKQYADIKTRYGDPLESVEKVRDNAQKLAKELESSAKDLAAKVRAWVPISGSEPSRAEPGARIDPVTRKAAQAADTVATKADRDAGKAGRPRTPTGE